jgi:acid phosphatase type 7
MLRNSWIDSHLQSEQIGIKIVQYHGPILTACKQGAYFDEIVIKKGIEHWLPLFDKHNITVVFENHTHSFKRSKRIKNGEANQNGTYYLGEGAWGATKPSGN